MTRFALDAPVALRLVGEEATLGSQHQVVAPGSLRSEMLALLYQKVRMGALQERQALALLDRVATTKMRLLADRVSRRVAWTVAADLDLADTHLAEYVAVTKLQADVLITHDPELRRIASGCALGTGRSWRRRSADQNPAWWVWVNWDALQPCHGQPRIRPRSIQVSHLRDYTLMPRRGYP